MKELALRQRMACPRTPEDKNRKEKLMEVFRRYGNWILSSALPFLPYALPFLAELRDENLYELISREEAAAMGLYRGYISEGKFSCPFCGRAVNKNQPCDDCSPRVTTDFDYGELLEKIQQEWDPFRKRWSDMVKQLWRLRQYKCSCGRWADTPKCPGCQRDFEEEQAPAKLKAALRGWIGKRIQVEIISFSGWQEGEETQWGPITLCGILAELKTERRKDEYGNRNNFVALQFKSGSKLETSYTRVVKVEESVIELEWDVEYRKFTNELVTSKIIRLKEVEENG